MSPASLLPLTAVSAFALSFAIAELIRRYGARLGLVQVPNHRSSHVKPTASGGGLGIAVAGTAFGIVLGLGGPGSFQVAVAVSAIGATIGFLDDRFDLSSILRIIAHFGLVAALLISTGIVPVPDSVTLPILPLLTLGILLLVGVWWINLFNFMDGIDGLASTEAIFLLGAALSFTVTATIGHGDAVVVAAMAIVIAACLGFLLLNWPPAKVFMGDAGSNYLAFFILAAALITLASGTMRYSVWAILPATFVTDATVTLVRRALSGERWLSAHRLHAYQKLSRRWNSHLASMLLYAAINLIWLYPLAYLAHTRPGQEWLMAGLAYIPLIAFCWLVGAGRPEPTIGTV